MSLSRIQVQMGPGLKISRATAISLFFFLMAGCTKEKREAVVSGSSDSGLPTLSSIQTDMFRLSCGTSGCHDNRANPAGGLDMSTFDRSYTNLVNRNSTQVTSMKLVNPGNPDKSYLVNKLVGTHANVGGSGSRMPQYAAALTSAELDRVVNWIRDGAQRN